MKNILFAAYDMNIGGIETSLVTLLNYLVKKDYNITLVLEKEEGVLLKELDNKITVIEYKPSNCRAVIIRKVINAIKRLCFTIKYKNKFDFSISYATYSKMASFVARTASTNNALWGHADYLELYNDEKKVKEFFEGLHYEEFGKIIFVSRRACKTFIQVFPNSKEKVLFCNNMRNYQNIKHLSNEEIQEKKTKYTFVNVGRHDEKQKKLTRIIGAAKLLKEDKEKFNIIFVGTGKDTKMYKDKVKEYNLEKEIKFVGAKKNPYPYMKLADCIILSSDYEGYPSVFVEAMILDRPIITTDTSDAMEDIEGKFGVVVEKNEEQIYKAMKKFINNGYEIKEKFNSEAYNEEILEKIEKMFDNQN